MLIFRACSSAGRAPRSQRGGRRFDPDHVHFLIKTSRKRGFFVSYINLLLLSSRKYKIYIDFILIRS